MKLITDVFRRLIGLPSREELTDTQRIKRLEGWMVFAVLLMLTAHPGLLWIFRTFFSAAALAQEVHQ